jgi:hypothetical protein
VPVIFNNNDKIQQCFCQNGLMQFCKERVDIPRKTTAAIITIYADFVYGATSVRPKRETSFIISLHL